MYFRVSTFSLYLIYIFTFTFYYYRITNNNIGDKTPIYFCSCKYFYFILFILYYFFVSGNFFVISLKNKNCEKNNLDFFFKVLGIFSFDDFYSKIELEHLKLKIRWQDRCSILKWPARGLVKDGLNCQNILNVRIGGLKCQNWWS